MRTAQHIYANSSQIDYALSFKKLPPEDKAEHNLIHSIQTLSGILKRNYSIDKYQELQKLKKQYESEYGKYELDHFELPLQEGSQTVLF